jgi:hypothetical protein
MRNQMTRDVQSWRDSRAGVQKCADMIAEFLHGMGFTAMANDCAGERLHGDLARYAQVVLKNLRRDHPKTHAKALPRFQALGLAP